MSYQGLTVLLVVPARGGSKSIPRKNLAVLSGLSLVARAAKVAAQLGWVDMAILSTDDEEIAEEGRRHGLSVPFMRPAELAGDLANSTDMWRQAWLATEEYSASRFDISLLLEPSSPLRTPEDIERTMETLIARSAASAVTVSRTPAHFTPQKTLKVVSGGFLDYYHTSGEDHSLRQSIPAYYHRNGICYAVTREQLIEERNILGNNCAAVVIDRQVVNIDDPFDLKLAEILIKEEIPALA